MECYAYSFQEKHNRGQILVQQVGYNILRYCFKHHDQQIRRPAQYKETGGRGWEERGGRERDRERQRDRQTDRNREERDRNTERQSD